MTDNWNERSSCCFRAEKSAGGKAIIRLQLFHCSMPLLKHAELSFNLLSSLSLEQAEAIADDLNEKVLDLSVTLSSDHPMFPRNNGDWPAAKGPGIEIAGSLRKFGEAE